MILAKKAAQRAKEVQIARAIALGLFNDRQPSKAEIARHKARNAIEARRWQQEAKQ